MQHPAGTGNAGEPAADPSLLAGFTIAVISHRRRHRLADLLERHGARIVSVQGVRAVPQPDRAAVARATADGLARPVDDVLAASAGGIRSWLQAAPDPEHLLRTLRTARLLAADARTADALRGHGLRDILSTAAGSADELFRYLLTHAPAGRHVLAQLDAPVQAEACQALRELGADVTEVPAFRPEPPNDVVGLRRVVELISRRQLDAVAWLDPLATGHVLRFAADHGRLPALTEQLGAHVVTVSRGPLAAGVLRHHGVTPDVPPLPFDEETAAALARSVLDRAVHTTLGAMTLEVRGHAALLDGRLYPIQQGPVDVLRALARAPGDVLSGADLRAQVPGLAHADDHAIEMAVSRLRRAVPGVELVHTVIKRGYRLAV